MKCYFLFACIELTTSLQPDPEATLQNIYHLQPFFFSCRLLPHQLADKEPVCPIRRPNQIPHPVIVTEWPVQTRLSCRFLVFVPRRSLVSFLDGCCIAALIGIHQRLVDFATSVHHRLSLPKKIRAASPMSVFAGGPSCFECRCEFSNIILVGLVSRCFIRRTILCYNAASSLP